MKHRFHSICPYFAMFPEMFVRKHLIWTRPGDIVFDPFSGRGTTIFESLLAERRSAGCDVNPVAVCISNAKADPPTQNKVRERLKAIQRLPIEDDDSAIESTFFQHCFHPTTLRQVLHLRRHLKWRTCKEDRFIAAIALGCLHGESHRSDKYFSNRMPRTISTKPEYSIRWWKKYGYIAPSRDVFKIISEMIDYRYVSSPAPLRGKVVEGDARSAFKYFPDYNNKVSLVITSPPYIDTTNYREDQWLRLWFLGEARKSTIFEASDDRHRNPEKYWAFLTEAWAGLAPLLIDNARLVIRIGGKKLNGTNIRVGLTKSLKVGIGSSVILKEERITNVNGGQIQAFQPRADRSKIEYDFIYDLKK